MDFRHVPRENQTIAAIAVTVLEKNIAHQRPVGPIPRIIARIYVTGILNNHSRERFRTITGTVCPEPWNDPMRTIINPNAKTDGDVIRNKSLPY